MTVWTGPMLDDALGSSPDIVGEDGGGLDPVSMTDYEFGIDPNAMFTPASDWAATVASECERKI